MQPDEARAVLGLPGPCTAEELRAAYHDAARRLHPDRPDAPADATEQMVRVNLAYAVLTGQGADADRGTPDAPAPEATARRPARSGRPPLGVSLFDDGSLLVDAPAEETFERLVEAIEAVGDPTYVDPDAGLLQIIVSPDDGRYCYLTFSLQGRAAGTEIFTTIERLDSVEAPDPWPVLLLLADSLRET